MAYSQQVIDLGIPPSLLGSKHNLQFLRGEDDRPK
jgi:hypothetical protein